MRLPRRRRAEPERWQIRGAAGVALGGFVLGLISLTVRLEPLLIPGIGFLLLGVLAPVWVLVTSSGAAISRGPLPRRVTEGDPFDTVIGVRGRAVALGPAVVHEPLSGRELSVRQRGRGARRGRARSERSLVVIAHAGRRGLHPVASPTLVVSDPLGLLRRRIVGHGPTGELLVLPRIEPVNWSAGGRGRLGRGEGASREPTGAGEVDGLRDYRAGAPASRIHWPSLARGSGLLERRLIAASETLPVIVLDSRCEDSTEGLEALDMAVRATGSLARELGLRGGCTVLLPGSRVPLTIRPDLRSFSGLQTRLALVAPEHDPRRGPRSQPEHTDRLLVYVRAAPLGEPRGLSTAAGGVLVEPSSEDDADRAFAFEVAGCRGYPSDRHSRRRAA